jgi:hypothetical protein
MVRSGTTVTETVYRKQIRPIMQDSATAMDGIFTGTEDDERSRGNQPAPR